MTGLGTFELFSVMAAVVIGVPLAAILHELTHVVMLLPVAEDVSVNWREMYVVASIPETAFVKRWARLAGLAPVIIGVLVAIGLVAAGMPLAEPWTPLGMAEWGVWMAYAIFGGASDYLPRLSRERGRGTDAD